MLNRKQLPLEVVFQIFALIVAFIVVHATYVAVVRPKAEALLEYQREQTELDETYTPERSFFIIVRDFEQEACFVLMLWAMAIVGFKAWTILSQRNLLEQELIPLSEGISILPEDAREYSRPIQALPDAVRTALLPRALLTALHRFRSTRNIQDVSTSVRTVCESESERLDSELSLVRYIAWAIPSIGFIGTVRGIGEALAQAHQAVEGNITGVTESLGTAFNSTFIALLLSIVLMFLVHQLQLLQERLVLDTQNYLDEHLIPHLQVR